NSIFVLLCHNVILFSMFSSFFFFNAPQPTEIYTLSLHDALPICLGGKAVAPGRAQQAPADLDLRPDRVIRHEQHPAHEGGWNQLDRKSTRLNSSHQIISYAVFCLKKKKTKKKTKTTRYNTRTQIR